MKQSKWIPVEQDIPKQHYGESEEVLCLLADGRRRVGLTCANDEWISAESGFPFECGLVPGSGKVVAWMELPEENK